MKKFLFFCLIPFILIACDDKKSDDNGNSGSGNGNNSGSQSDDAKVLDNLLAKGELTAKETEFFENSCREEGDEYDVCLENTLLEARIIKAINCYDKLEAIINCDNEACDDSASEALSTCFATNIKPYAKDIENTSMYKAMNGYSKRNDSCCQTWGGDDAEYCNEEKEDAALEKYLSVLMYLNHKCASQLVAVYTCANKLSCSEPADSDDHPVYALCEDSDSSIYIGGNYTSSSACEDELTYHCQKESDAVKACFGQSEY